MITITKDDIGKDWVDLVSDLSLDINNSYTLQNVTPYPLEYKLLTSAPLGSDFGNVLSLNQSVSVFISDGVRIYVRNQKQDDNKKCKIVVSYGIYTSNSFCSITDSGGNLISLTTNNSGEYELPISLNGHVCQENSSSTPLLADGIFEGSWQDTLGYGVIIIGIKTDQDSVTDGLEILWSADGVLEDDSDVFTVDANAGRVFTFGSARRYVKVRYTNSSSDQTLFRLQTLLKRVYSKASSHRISDSIVSDDDAELIKSVLSGEDQDGSFQNVKTTRDGNLTISDNSSGLSIASGNVTGASFIHKFGLAPDFATTDGEVSVWDGANDSDIGVFSYTYSSTAAIDSISSSNNSDTQNVEIQGLDSDYNSVTQTVALTGQTRKALTTNLIRVFRMKNVGSTNFAGFIYCYENTPLSSGVPIDTSKIRASVDDGTNQTLMAIYTVPAGKTGYMQDWYAATAGSNKASNYIIKVKARPFGQVFQTKHVSSISDSGSSHVQHNYTEPEVFIEKTDIEITVQMTAVGASGAAVSAGFDIVLIDN